MFSVYPIWMFFNFPYLFGWHQDPLGFPSKIRDPPLGPWVQRTTPKICPNLSKGGCWKNPPFFFHAKIIYEDEWWIYHDFPIETAQLLMENQWTWSIYSWFSQKPPLSSEIYPLNSWKLPFFQGSFPANSTMARPRRFSSLMKPEGIMSK
jgi:hypothetical protein